MKCYIFLTKESYRCHSPHNNIRGGVCFVAQYKKLKYSTFYIQIKVICWYQKLNFDWYKYVVLNIPISEKHFKWLFLLFTYGKSPKKIKCVNLFFQDSCTKPSSTLFHGIIEDVNLFFQDSNQDSWNNSYSFPCSIQIPSTFIDGKFSCTLFLLISFNFINLLIQNPFVFKNIF